MSKKAVFILFLFSCVFVKAHDIRQEAHSLRAWKTKDCKNHIDASFLLFRNDTVFLETADDGVVRFHISSLCDADRYFVSVKAESIAGLNSQPISNEVSHETRGLDHDGQVNWSIVLFISSLLFLTIAVRFTTSRRVIVSSLALIGFALISAGPSRTHTQLTVSDPLWMDSAFLPFKPYINTFWDSTYFHVESNGIPTTHSMMTGITKWQQQVPIPQCYQGNNSWSIPLNPVLAAIPVPVNQQHFLRGAVAMAANGVPIFNPYTNTGVDAFLDGQLDNWGGHSGRADDYHYHTAPLHLYNHVAPNAPIAFGLDGFAVYGSFEPDGSPALPLDTNHGHFGTNGVYHYHGSTAAPYMIGRMVGQVTEDTTLQIVPQARAYPVRPSLTPLNGAAITGFHPNGPNGYTLIYTLAGQIDSIEYLWNNTGQYTYNFYTLGTGVPTVQNYNGFVQCSISTGLPSGSNELVVVYPNPVIDRLYVKGVSGEITMIIYDVAGKKVKTAELTGSSVSFDGTAGLYYYDLITKAGRYSGRFIKQ